MDLSFHVAILIPIKMESVRRFIDGLTFGIRLQIAKDTWDDIFFQPVVVIVRRIGRIRGQGREAVYEKRSRHFGNFSSASS